MPNQWTYANVAVMLHQNGIRSRPRKAFKNRVLLSVNQQGLRSNYAKSRGCAGPN